MGNIFSNLSNPKNFLRLFISSNLRNYIIYLILNSWSIHGILTLAVKIKILHGVSRWDVYTIKSLFLKLYKAYQCIYIYI